MKNFLFFLAAGFVLASCEKETKDCPGAIDKTFPLAGFTKITAAETFTLRVTQGPFFSINAKGCADDLADLNVSVNSGGFLQIGYNRYKGGRYKMEFDVTMPVLNSFNLGGAATGTATGFDVQPTFLRAVLDGTAQCTINGLPQKVEASCGGAGTLTLTGTTDLLNGNFGGNSSLKGYGATAKEADVNTDGTAKIYVSAQQKLTARAAGASRIYYKGSPAATDLEQVAEGRIIHE